MSEEASDKIVAYPTRDNPPHLGTLMELASVADTYDTVYVVYCGGDGIVSPTKWVQMVDSVLGTFTDKFKYITSGVNFTDIKKLPVELQELGVTKIVTSSNKIFMQCAINGVRAARLTKAQCYYNLFQQLAYSKGFIMDNLINKFKHR